MLKNQQFTFRPGQAAAAQILYDGIHHLGIFTSTGMSFNPHLEITYTKPHPDQGVERPYRLS
jgi:hypothetical protein